MLSSLAVLTQVPPQAVRPLGQASTQALPTQVSSAPQRFPQKPQFRGSLAVSTHVGVSGPCPITSSQAVNPVWQLSVQVPSAQSSPGPHWMPQPPQWLGSLAVVAHPSLQATCPLGQLAAQAPLVQVCPAPHAFPQLPQFA